MILKGGSGSGPEVNKRYDIDKGGTGSEPAANQRYAWY